MEFVIAYQKQLTPGARTEKDLLLVSLFVRRERNIYVRCVFLFSQFWPIEIMGFDKKIL